jgi:nitroreductase
VELRDAIRQRAMCRSFSDEPLDRSVVDRIVASALRSPTAGNARGVSWVVLEGHEETSVYWETTTDDEWRSRNGAWAAGLRRAPVVLLAYASPAAYVARYAAPEKADAGLGAGCWPVPYWYGDAAFGVMTVLLGAVDVGLGACILGAFRGERALATRLAVPPDWSLFCAVALGRSDGQGHRSRSLDRDPVRWQERVHRGSW